MKNDLATATTPRHRRRPLLGQLATWGSWLAAVAAIGCSPDSGPTTDPQVAAGRARTGTLTVTISGLPSGTPAAVTVTGPNGYQRSLSASATLSALPTGSYTLAALPTTAGGSAYAPTPATQTVTVNSGKGGANASVNYALAVGSLALTITGLPTGTGAAVTVTGPNGFTQTVVASATLGGLAPGSYSIGAAPVVVSGQTYNPTPVSATVSVVTGATTSAAVTYAGTLGGLSVALSGLPTGASGSVTVTGPNGFTQAVATSQTLTNLAPGTYQVAAASVVVSGVTYQAAPANQTVAVTAGVTASAPVGYTAIGDLAITVAGLPTGTPAALTVTGPAGYSSTVTQNTTLAGLVTGTYTVTAANLTSGSTYVPVPASQSVSVIGGTATTATVTYQVQSAATLNLRIAGMYLTQATARFDGTTPLVANRDGYLRVFAVANQANTATPTVRVRLYSGTTLIQTSTLTGPATGVPTAANEGSLAASWNLLIPAALIQPNLKVLADVDPAAVVGETDETDNQFPRTGATQAVDVRSVPTWNVRFVPVLQAVNSLQGNVTTSNMASFLRDALKMLPVSSYSADVRAPYTTTAPALDGNNTSGAWGTILSELLALRNAEAATRYYYGVVKTSYSSGVAGMGYVGGGYNTSIGWDYLPSGSDVMVHEVGHNMGRWHSPCGGAGQVDGNYPYANGSIGVYGLDLSTLAVKTPTGNNDFMGYCGNDWVSDYTWNNIISYRQSSPNYAPPAAAANAVGGLLVWGRITHAGVTLEPAFRVDAPMAAPTGNGDYRIEGLAADGTVLFTYPVDPQHTMTHRTEHESHFAAVVPLDQAQDDLVAEIRLVTPDGTVGRLSTESKKQPRRRPTLPDPAARMQAPSSVQAKFDWDGGLYPMAMVRDAETGDVLSFARGGSATLWTTKRRFTVTFSDGVRSVVRNIQ